MGNVCDEYVDKWCLVDLLFLIEDCLFVLLVDIVGFICGLEVYWDDVLEVIV